MKQIRKPEDVLQELIYESQITGQSIGEWLNYLHDLQMELDIWISLASSDFERQKLINK